MQLEPNITLHSIKVSFIPKEGKEVSEFHKYRTRVRSITESVKHLIPGIEKRDFKSHHVDHKISIWDGFKLGFTEEEIGGLDNLRVISDKENMIKGRKSIL